MTQESHESEIFTYKPPPVTEPLRWQIQVFPYKSVKGTIVEWNSIVRRQDPGEDRWQVVVLKPKKSPEMAKLNAQNWVRNRFQ